MMEASTARAAAVPVHCGRHVGRYGRKIDVIDHRGVLGAETATIFGCPDHGPLPAVSAKRLSRLWTVARMPALSGQPSEPIVL
jgi:hypothetical protein